ncbi:MAG TPA: hypothetical protein PK112_04625, partial [candidate division Zixibacteria bacterium]|nr:hypothetical protein [candidate division Zixibacteria bacterium]
MTAGLKGGRFLYYIEVRDKIGGQRAVFLDGGRPFVMKYVGHVPTWLLLTHIALMFATVYFVVIGALHGARLTGGGTDVFPMARAYGIAALCAFLGGYPFGIPMNWFTFGTTWEGVPFGTDATDNKTQLLFVYLLLVVFAAFGSLTRRRVGRDAYPPRVLGWLGVLGFAVMLGIYLIPHSIQFSPALTRIVCWSFIGLAAAAYFGGLAAGIVRRRAPRAHKAERRAG